MGMNGLTGINSMQAIISAGSALTQVQRQGSVVTNMKGREGVLGAEIKLDSARGGNVEKKQEELEEVQKRLNQVQSTQMDILSEASKKLEEARKEDQKAEEKAEKVAKKKEAEKKKVDQKADKKDIENVADTENVEGVNIDAVTEMPQKIISETVNISVQGTSAYPHVDVRL